MQATWVRFLGGERSPGEGNGNWLQYYCLGNPMDKRSLVGYSPWACMWAWTIKKAEHWKIYAFALWCWRKLLSVPWTARRSNQFILKEISSEYSLDCCWSWNSNTLATWCEELAHWKRPWCWERLKAKGEGDDRGWDGWIASLAQCTWVWANWELVIDREPWHAAVHGVAKCRTRLSDWTERKWIGNH